MVGVLGGYQFARFWGLELVAGYVSVAESMTRRVTAQSDQGASFFSGTYEDSTKLSGPFAAIGASYRVFETTPLTVRLAGGEAVLASDTRNAGTFTGVVTNPNDATDTSTVTGVVSIPEARFGMLVPFGETEVRVGYRISSAFTADAGIAFAVFFPPSDPRTSNSSGRDRRANLDAGAATFADGTPAMPGVVTLPRESIASTFAAVVPSVGVRLDF
jgi:hypothetical protein